MPKQAFLLNNKGSQELEYTNVTRKKPFCEPTHDFTEIQTIQCALTFTKCSLFRLKSKNYTQNVPMGICYKNMITIYAIQYSFAYN